jgi:alpha-L-arabinofuranosidase
MGGMIWIAAALASGLPADDATIKVDAGNVINRVSPLMYGSCIEDVNHEIYGGFYAQMIFGESFEEPPPSHAPKGWTPYGGQWAIDGGSLSVGAHSGAKIVRDEGFVGDGTISCQVRFQDDQGVNAGLIVRVGDAKVGADSWVGYEVSLSARNKSVMLGRHRDNFTELKTARADIRPKTWHRLRVEMIGTVLRVYVDDSDQPAIIHDDAKNLIAPGRIGLRTWFSNAEFRDLVVESWGRKAASPFVSRADDVPGREVSGMWDAVRTGDAAAKFDWDADRPYNTDHSQRIEYARGNGTVGVSNRGLNRWGQSIRAGHRYDGRLYLRQEGYEGAVTVALQSADGAKTYATATLAGTKTDWSAYDFSLSPTADDPNARFAVWIDRPGKVWIDQVYLSGTDGDLFRGLPMRADLGDALRAEGLTLLRYGGSMVNAPGYRWKTMIGPRDKRPQYKGWWYPYTTNGFGIEEFVQFCRAAGIEPVVSINVEETPQDAADLVDYLNGPLTSTWGRRRAENGHPQPYGVKYIQLGNEETTNAHYVERFHLVYDAMRPRDASVQYIIAAWWEPDNPISKRIVQELGDKASLWDVHVGGDAPREGAKVDAIFVRMKRLYEEWAPGTKLKACILEENGGRHDLARALGHAGIVNASQRHGDFVLIQCPANCLQPWKQNDNDWDQGQLFFTPSQVWGMPPYYAQKMASSAHLPCRVGSEVISPGDDLDATVTKDDSGSRLVLKVVNVGDSSHRAAITLDGFGPVSSDAKVQVLSGRLDDVNGPDTPTRIAPMETTRSGVSDRFTHEFPARSYTILTLDKKR